MYQSNTVYRNHHYLHFHIIQPYNCLLNSANRITWCHCKKNTLMARLQYQPEHHTFLAQIFKQHCVLSFSNTPTDTCTQTQRHWPWGRCGRAAQQMPGVDRTVGEAWWAFSVLIAALEFHAPYNSLTPAPQTLLPTPHTTSIPGQWITHPPQPHCSYINHSIHRHQPVPGRETREHLFNTVS